MPEIWFRGESTNAFASKAGGHLHDFGDGVYFTNSSEVAQQYASTRCTKSGGDAKVFQITVERTALGRVLDLSRDPRWRQFLDEPLVPGKPQFAPGALIKQANENYSRFFQMFLSKHKININDYDAVIGQEFVRGGLQLAILHKSGKPSYLATQLRKQFQLLPDGVSSVSSTTSAGRVPRLRGSAILVKARSVSRATVGQRAIGALKSRAVVEMLGQLLGGAIAALGDRAIRRQIDEKLTTQHGETIEKWLGEGLGVLVVIRMQEWERPDFNGMRAHNLLGVHLEAGKSEQEAIRSWQNTPRILPGPEKGWRSTESYAWIDPGL